MATASNIPLQNKDLKFGYKQRSYNWTSLRLLNIYRVGVAAIFFAQSFVNESPLFHIEDLTLYAWTSFIYLVLSMVMILSTWIDRRNFQYQVSIQVYIDIFAIIILMHAAGGISSGLGTLLIISIAVTGLLGKESLALVFASIASVGLLAEYIISVSYDNFSGTSTQVGLLGAALFATALVTQNLVKRLRSSEALIQKQRLDVANLSALNAEILQNMQAGVIALDGEDQVRHINSIANTMLQSRPERPLIDYSLPVDTRQVFPEIHQMLMQWRSNPNKFNNLLLTSKSGTDIQITFHNLQSASHQGTLIYLDDVSVIKQQMRQSKLASLGQLTANIAHEIRNPLSAISHAAQLLAENDQLQNTDKRMTEIIQQHSNRINSIIEDILQISRGHQTSSELIDLKQWIPKFIDSFCLSGEATPSCFNLEMDESNELELLFDANHLTRIMTNLCSNAKNHSQSEKPITIRITGSQDDGSTIEIADKGPGIPPKEREKIFEPFYTTSHTGTGLGLYIVNELCDLNEASISVMENEFGGASFVIKK